MKVIIEIEKDEEIEKLKNAFRGENITVIRTRKNKNRILDTIFRKYNVKLTRNYTFDREAIHAR